MNLTHQPILPLLRSVAIEPAACRRTALAMAAAADSAGGTLAASMATFRSRRSQLWQLVLSPNGVPGGYVAPR